MLKSYIIWKTITVIYPSLLIIKPEPFVNLQSRSKLIMQYTHNSLNLLFFSSNTLWFIYKGDRSFYVSSNHFKRCSNNQIALRRVTLCPCLTWTISSRMVSVWSLHKTSTTRKESWLKRMVWCRGSDRLYKKNHICGMLVCKCEATGAVWEVNVHKSKVNEIAFFNVQPNTPRIHECTLKTKHSGIIQYMRLQTDVFCTYSWLMSRKCI